MCVCVCVCVCVYVCMCVCVCVRARARVDEYIKYAILAPVRAYFLMCGGHVCASYNLSFFQ